MLLTIGSLVLSPFCDPFSTCYPRSLSSPATSNHCSSPSLQKGRPSEASRHPYPLLSPAHISANGTVCHRSELFSPQIGVISDVSRSEEVHRQPVLPGQSPLPLPPSLHSAACFLSNNPESLLTILLPNRFCTVLLLIPTLSSGFVRVSFCT